MVTIAMIRVDRAVAESLAKGVDHFESEYRLKVGPMMTFLGDIVGKPSTVSSGSRPGSPWRGYLVVDEIQRSVVGTCAFKGPPEDGTVEIAYFTFPGFEGRGYATAMARKLVDFAKASPEVSRITARTLREPSASTAVLKKVGMCLAGDVLDPDDGIVWEWEYRTCRGEKLA